MLIIITFFYYAMIAIMVISVAAFYKIMKESFQDSKWIVFFLSTTMFITTTVVNTCIVFESYTLILGPIEHALFQ